MIRVPVGAGTGQYQALVGSGLLRDVGSALGNVVAGKACAVVTDTAIGKLFGKRLERSLTNAGFRPITITIPAGEQSKTLQQAGEICDQIIAAGLDRQSFVIGLGGGVIGDVSGFVAAIFHRGVPHVQIPTTLLAMVDSSIGGKTGVNTRDGKNLLGATHQPVLVIDDVDLLETLPDREFKQGFAEIIKHAVIADAEMFYDLSKSGVDRFNRSSSSDELVQLIARNIQIKANVVAHDEFDRTGHRAILNFGHTIGHGIERAADYKTFLHGEAISLGMAAACDISIKRAGLDKTDRDAVIDLLGRFDLPTQLPKNFPKDKIFEALKHDKKFERGEVRFVVTPKIGSARLTNDVTFDDIREAIELL